MYRSNKYDEDFKRDIFDHPDARQVYLLTLMEDEDEPMSLEEALRFTIRRLGTVDFARLVGEQKQNIDKFLKGRRNPKPETLNRYLKPFGLRVKIGVEKLKAA